MHVIGENIRVGSTSFGRWKGYDNASKTLLDFAFTIESQFSCMTLEPDYFDLREILDLSKHLSITCMGSKLYYNWKPVCYYKEA
jgi:hypothetical protein